MALLLTVATGAWAQDPDPIDLTPSADGTVWTLSTMPIVRRLSLLAQRVL